MPPAKPPFKFAEGEKVLCFHGPMLYEAKTLKSEQKDKTIRYFVHYQGWNKSWDEWVPENRVLKFCQENIEKQRELRDSADANKAKKKKRSLDGEASVPSPSAPTSSAKSTRAAVSAVSGSSGSAAADLNRKKVRLEPNVESEAEFLKKMEVKIKMPDELKNWLVDDWDLITRKKYLVEIPARTSVQQILDDYVDSKKASKAKESQVLEVTSGLREYFDAMVGCQLLYKFEKPQYSKIVKESPEDATMSSVYGAIHLLRLFVRLGQMLVYSDLDEKDVNVLLTHVHDFLRFLARSTYFSKDLYIPATPEYVRKAM